MARRVCLLFLLLPALVFADTTWVSPGDVQGLWTADHSPYMVQFAIRIPPDTTLTIAPGVEVNFTALVRLTVEGNLWANGTATDRIRFHRNPGDSLHRWSGIAFLPTSTAQFRYCTIAWMSADPDGGLDINCSSVSFESCTFQHNVSHVLYLQFERETRLEFCDFLENGTPGSGPPGSTMYLVSRSTAYLYACSFIANGALDGGAIQANSGAFLSLYRCVFKNNIAGIWGGAIYAAGATIDALRCTFVGNRSLEGSHVMAAGTTSVTILNSCIFAFSRHVGGAFWFTGHIPTIHNCAVFGNQPIFLNGVGPANFGVLDYTNSNGTPCDLYANILVDPLFADTSSNLLTLLADSPCIDAADSFFGQDPDGTPADIGAIPFTHTPTWSTIQFPSGLAGIGCPCNYPFQLPEGSPVRLRHDRTRNGPSGDDDVVASFAITAGAGLPPWDGYWTPQTDGHFVIDSFYVELLTPTCCWLSSNLHFDGTATATLDPASWSCHDAATESGCMTTDAELLEPAPPQDSLQAIVTTALQVLPNPFNASTELRFALGSRQQVDLTIYDVMGRVVTRLASGEFESGLHRVRFDGTDLATGIYFVMLRTGSSFTVHKLLLLK